MKTKEQILLEIQKAMTLNKDNIEKCNSALSDAKSLIMHETKEFQNRLDEEYKRGMNDAWEIAKEFCKIQFDESITIFGTDSVDQIIRKHTLFEIKDRISSHNAKKNEKNKIHVGDVVQNNDDDTKATILDNDHNTNLVGEGYWIVFTENGCVESWYKDNFTKTGETVDVCSALIK